MLQNCNNFLNQLYGPGMSSNVPLATILLLMKKKTNKLKYYAFYVIFIFKDTTPKAFLENKNGR